jgi:hypothetical protein
VNWELSSNVTALEELSVPEQAAQDKVWALGEEKRLLEQEMTSTRTMFAEWDYSSSEVIPSVVVYTVALLKSYVPDLDPELLRKEYQYKDGDEWDAITEGVLDATQHFVSEYDFFVAND